jgi:hypothetical protein
MPLEDLTGSKYISDLNANWPIDDDRLKYTDDHLRGVKNVLKLSFPNVTGPVTRSHTSLSNGSVPVGSVTVFYQLAPPTGWTRVTGIAATQLLRVIDTANTTDGGTAAGTDDPVLNDKVPSHTHPAPLATTSSNAASHTHSLGIGINGTITIGAYGTPNFTTANVTGTSGNTGATKPDHTHTVQVTVSANTGANWVPRYLNVILCERTS